MVRSKTASAAYILPFAALVIVLSSSLSGCSDISEGFERLGNFRFSEALGGASREVEVLWESGAQFVRLEPQDSPKEGTWAPNSQPVKFSREWIRGALRLILVKQSPKDDAVPLFTDENIHVLGRYLEEGLAKARPDQDVTFAVAIGRTALLELLKEPKVTTGRVFFAGNQLNLIFGSILRDGSMDGGNPKTVIEYHDGTRNTVSKYDGPWLKPYTPGRRDISMKQSVILSTPPQSGVYRAAGVNRVDWLVITGQARVAQGPVTAPQGWPPTGSGYYQQPAPGVGGPQPWGRGQRQAPPTSSQTTKERLTVLKRLYENGLISQEQYTAKQNQILQGF